MSKSSSRDRSLASKKKFFKSVGTVGVITLLSRILGLAREIARATILGTSVYSDAFTLAFSLPNLFRRLTAEGIMSTAFIPVYTELKNSEGQNRANGFARNFFWFATLILIGLTLLFILAAPWLVEYIFAAGYTGEALDITVFLTRLMFAYVILISLAAICQGVLNSCGTFWVSSITPVFLNISIIGCAVLLSPQFTNPAIGFAIGVLLGGAVQLLFQVPHLKSFGLSLLGRVHLSDPKIKEALILMLPAVFGAGVYQLNIILSNLIATTLGEGALSSLSFSNRILELVLGIFVVSLATVILPRFADLFAENKIDQIKKSLVGALGVIAYITLPVIFGIYILSEEIIHMLFVRGSFGERSLFLTTGALQFHILGLIFISWNRVLLTAYQATRTVKRTVQISAVIMIVNILSAYLLSLSYGHLGIAMANTISQMLQTILLFYFLKELSLSCRLLSIVNFNFAKIMASCLLMTAALMGAKSSVWLQDMHIFIKTPVYIIIGVVVFALSSTLLGIKEQKELLGLIFKKVRR